MGNVRACGTATDVGACLTQSNISWEKSSDNVNFKKKKKKASVKKTYGFLNTEHFLSKNTHDKEKRQGQDSAGQRECGYDPFTPRPRPFRGHGQRNGHHVLST